MSRRVGKLSGSAGFKFFSFPRSRPCTACQNLNLWLNSTFLGRFACGFEKKPICRSGRIQANAAQEVPVRNVERGSAELKGLLLAAEPERLAQRETLRNFLRLPGMMAPVFPKSRWRVA